MHNLNFFRTRHKILTNVDCPMDLDMGKFIANNGDSSLSSHYELYGMIVKLLNPIDEKLGSLRLAKQWPL